MQSCTRRSARVSCHWQRPRASHLAGRRSSPLTYNAHTIKQCVATLRCYIDTRVSIWKGRICHQWRRFSERQSNGFFFMCHHSSSSCKVLFFSFQTWLIAIKILCLALAVTNAPGNWKGADIVFFLWHDLWDFIIFWWITVYSECMHEARIFTWRRRLAVIAPEPSARKQSLWWRAGERC